MKQEHNKLVRDKIPNIIVDNGETPIYHQLKDDNEYLECLFDKDLEEGSELRSVPNLEELVDKLEVLYAIGEVLGYSKEQIEDARKKKATERGSFKLRIFLEKTF